MVICIQCESDRSQRLKHRAHLHYRALHRQTDRQMTDFKVLIRQDTYMSQSLKIGQVLTYTEEGKNKKEKQACCLRHFVTVFSLNKL